MHKYLNSDRLFCSDVVFYSQVEGGAQWQFRAAIK